MASINDLPAELILFIAKHLSDDILMRRAWRDVSGLALTNRKHHSILNTFLYSLAVEYRYPLFWAAQAGEIGTLKKLLNAGSRCLGCREWSIDRTAFPTEYTVGLWAGRCQSANTRIGIIDDTTQLVKEVSIIPLSKQTLESP